ncbi:ribonuclease H-like domain-containing protein [Tanacetum coccineum]
MCTSANRSTTSRVLAQCGGEYSVTIFCGEQMLFDFFDAAHEVGPSEVQVPKEPLMAESIDLFLGKIFSDNASEVWAELKETYDKLDGSIIFNLLQKIHGFKQEKNIIEALPLLLLLLLLLEVWSKKTENPGPKQNDYNKTCNANFASTFNDNGTSLSFTNERIIKLMNLINEVPSGTVKANMTYHYRLGYPSDKAVDVLQSNLKFTKNSHISPFDICYKAKQTREPFPLSDHKTTIIGELVHIDLWDLTKSLQPDLRRSGRNFKLPAKFNDYVIGSSRKYRLEKYVSYSNLSKNNYCFSTTLNKSSEPTTYYEALKDPNWIESMNNEIETLNRNNTWMICDLPKGRKAVGSKWQFKIKYKSTGAIDRYKARLVFKGFSQREGFDYMETFSPVVKISTSKFDFSLFTKKSDKVFIALLVYVDDIVITGNDLIKIEKFKMFLKSKFQIKDLGKLKYFLGIEVLDNKEGICLSQRKYYLELLHEYGLLAAKHVDTPLPENTTLNHIETDDDHFLDNIGNYQKLMGKLIYLTNTRPAISYVVHCLSQYMHAPLVSHLDASLRVLRYLKGSPGSEACIRLLCVFGDSLVTWKSKKQSTLSRSSAETDYRSMASATCEVNWLSNLLGDMGVKDLLPVVMYYDNNLALQIAANLVFHEKSKHFEIDVHLALDIEQHKTLCVKLGMMDMFKVKKLEGRITIYGSHLLILLAYAPSMPPLLLLPLSMACDDSDGATLLDSQPWCIFDQFLFHEKSYLGRAARARVCSHFWDEILYQWHSTHLGFTSAVSGLGSYSSDVASNSVFVGLEASQVKVCKGSSRPFGKQKRRLRLGSSITHTLSDEVGTLADLGKKRRKQTKSNGLQVKKMRISDGSNFRQNIGTVQEEADLIKIERRGKRRVKAMRKWISEKRTKKEAKTTKPSTRTEKS